jgi:hypothetical protein
MEHGHSVGEEVQPCPRSLTPFTLTLKWMQAARFSKTFESIYKATAYYYNQKPQTEQLAL